MGLFVWACRALKHYKRRFPARAVLQTSASEAKQWKIQCEVLSTQLETSAAANIELEAALLGYQKRLQHLETAASKKAASEKAPTSPTALDTSEPGTNFDKGVDRFEEDDAREVIMSIRREQLVDVDVRADNSRGPGGSQDPFAPPPGPRAPSPHSLKRTENPLGGT
jgi:hypothetical protein